MEIIRTALLSYGMSGSVFHAPLLQAHPSFNLYATVERKVANAKFRYPDIISLKKVEDVFADPNIELVIVNTPSDTHFDFARKALEAGKHVVVEKPFTVTADEATQLIELANANKKLLTVFQNRRWDGDFLTLKKVIDNQLVGKVVAVEMHYDRFRNFVEANTWKEEIGRGTGIVYNLGSHMIDQALVLFGLPQEVDARIGIQRPLGKVDDFYDIRLDYKTFQVTLKASYLVREEGPRYTIHGTHGSFIKYGIDPQEQALKDGDIPGKAGWGVDEKTFWGKLNTTLNDLHFVGSIETIPGNYLAFYDSLYESIRHQKTLAVPPQESADGIRIIEACYASNASRNAIKINS